MREFCGHKRDVELRLRALPAFSLVFDLRTHFREVWRAFRILHYEKFFCCLPGYWLSAARPPGRWNRPSHIGLRSLSLAEAALGASVAFDNHFVRSPAAAAMARELLPDGRTYVGLAPGSGETYKNWPLERFGALAAQLEQRGITVVLIRGVNEQSYVDAIFRALPNAIDSAEVTASLDGLIAVADRLALVVVNNFGIRHVCAAAGRSVVSLFGVTDPRRWAPIGPAVHVIRAQAFGGRSVDAIPVDAVLKVVDGVLAASGDVSGGACPHYAATLLDDHRRRSAFLSVRATQC